MILTKPNRRAFRLALRLTAATLLTFMAFLAIQGCNNAAKEAGAPTPGKGKGGRRGDGGGPVPVLVTTVSQKDVPINIDVIGNVEAYSTISVKAQVTGQLTKTWFQEGDYVKKGDQLLNGSPDRLAVSGALACPRDDADLRHPTAHDADLHRTRAESPSISP